MPTPGAQLTVKLDLVPKGFWVIGGGDGIEADLTPVMTSRISWGKKGGKVGERSIFIPGTAFKGPLAHRVAYYYNALQGVEADTLGPDEINEHTGSRNNAVRELFGYAKDAQEGRPGRIFIDDVVVKSVQRKTLNHVSIDRFTGGARTMSGALFSESAVFKGAGMNLIITVAEADNIDADAIKAFRLALQDLADGQLAIGGGTGRGNGFFEARTTTWIGGGND